MIRRVPILNTFCNISEYTNIDCPKENVIFVFSTSDNQWPVEFWKINIELLIKTSTIGMLLEHAYVCNSDIPINEKGFVILQFEKNCPNDLQMRNFLILALLFNKIKFSFDDISLQFIFNNLSEDKQADYPYYYDLSTFDEISELDISGVSTELTYFFELTMDDQNNIMPELQSTMSWGESFNIVDGYIEICQKKTKKIQSDIKRRETIYRSRGYEIIPGNDALVCLKRPNTHTLLAIDTSHWCSIEYIDTDLRNGKSIDLFFFRFISNGKICKETHFSDNEDFNEFVSDTRWAIRKKMDVRW